MTIPRRFSPAPGITVDIAASSITISGRAETWGPQSTRERAATIQGTINRIWTASFTNGFRSSCSITVTHRGLAPASEALQIEIVPIAGPSSTDQARVYGTPSIRLNSNGQDVYSWVVAHEFGHLLGMDDRYSETVVSQLCSGFGCTRNTTIDRGYAGLLMAAHNGAMDTRTLDDLAAETAPAPWWINDDDQTRDWVMNATSAAISALPGRQMVQAIRVLMGYWISDEDVAAIERICANVGSAGNARMIREAINPLDFSSIGQRTRIRVAFAGMP